MDPQNPQSVAPTPIPAPSPMPMPTPAQIPVAEVPVQNKKGLSLLIVGMMLLILGLALGAYYFIFVKNAEPGLPPAPVAILPQEFINCSDVRQVLAEDDLLYVACLGGVLITDKSGNVIDQIGMPQGLSNSIATSIVKNGDRLFIGSQDGVNVFDLTTRENIKLGVAEGLVNGANVLVFADGDSVWAATFDGVSRIDAATLQITNYTTELDAAAEKRNIVNALVTDDYVYFLEVASAYSSGAVVMFNKTTGKFKAFKPDAFGFTDQYSRVDFNSIARFDNTIFVSQNSSLYMSQAGSDTWQKVESPYGFIRSNQNDEYVGLNVLANTDSKGVLMASGNRLYRYMPETDTTEEVYNFGDDYAGFLFRNSGETVWMRGPGNSAWISGFDLVTEKLSAYNLSRPFNFHGIVAVIDEKAIVQTDLGIYKYDPVSTEFAKMESFGLPGYPEADFMPISGTSKVFTFWQSCGQGCEKPLVQIYDYLTGEVMEVQIPDDVLSAIQAEAMGGFTYNSIKLAWHNVASSEIGLQNPAYVKGPKNYLAYNYDTDSWTVTDNPPDEAVKIINQNGIYCNRIYRFVENGNTFGSDDCNGVAQSGNLEWTVEDGELKETNKTDGQSRILDFPVLPAKYTPFDSVGGHSVTSISFVDGKLWIVTSLGLVSYTPGAGESEYKLYGPSNGILSQEIGKAYISDHIWVFSNWGGLSVIEK